MAAPFGLDPLNIAKDARKIYIRIRDAPVECRNIENENNTMILLLSLTIQKAENFAFDEEVTSLLVSVFDECRDTGAQILTQLEKYARLQTGSNGPLKILKRARWASGTTRDAKEVLTSHILKLGTLYNGMQSVMLDAKFDQAVQLIRADIREQTRFLNASMQQEFELLRQEFRLEQQQNAGPSELANVTRPFRGQLLQRIENTGSCPPEVYGTLEAALWGRTNPYAATEEIDRGWAEDEDDGTTMGQYAGSEELEGEEEDGLHKAARYAATGLIVGGYVAYQGLRKIRKYANEG